MAGLESTGTPLMRGFQFLGMILAALPRTQVHQLGGLLAIANGRSVGEIGLTAISYIRFL